MTERLEREGAPSPAGRGGESATDITTTLGESASLLEDVIVKLKVRRLPPGCSITAVEHSLTFYYGNMQTKQLSKAKRGISAVLHVLAQYCQ